MRGRRNRPENAWNLVVVRGPDECWPWAGTHDKHGYGRIWIAGKFQAAHRVIFELATGTAPGPMHVCHHCDNPGCVNPAHLFLGTSADNHADKIAKGRQGRGEGLPQSRLTEDQVREIRALYSAGMSQRKIATRFGITQPNVGFICRRETWRHVA